MARIDQRIEADCEPIDREQSFTISASTSAHRAPRGVTPDAAVCRDCARELLDPDDRRFGHALISCSDCGPRYSIIRSAPYDCCNTTIDQFGMYPACAHEYADPSDRRRGQHRSVGRIDSWLA